MMELVLQRLNCLESVSIKYVFFKEEKGLLMPVYMYFCVYVCVDV